MIPNIEDRFSDQIARQARKRRPASVPGVFVQAAADPATQRRGTDMNHKFSIGQTVYYEPTFGNAAARGKYKVIRLVPVENDNRVNYRIKSLAESYERIAEEHQLSGGE
jgi:hypothetical protein